MATLYSFRRCPYAMRARMALLEAMNLRLAAHANLYRAQRPLTDIAIMPLVRQYAAVDRAWFDAQPIARVRRWLDAHVASPLFGEAMVRVKPWAQGDAPVIVGWFAC